MSAAGYHDLIIAVGIVAHAATPIKSLLETNKVIQALKGLFLLPRLTISLVSDFEQSTVKKCARYLKIS